MFVKNIKPLGGFRSEYYWLAEKLPYSLGSGLSTKDHFKHKLTNLVVYTGF